MTTGVKLLLFVLIVGGLMSVIALISCGESAQQELITCSMGLQCVQGATSDAQQSACVEWTNLSRSDLSAYTVCLATECHKAAWQVKMEKEKTVLPGLVCENCGYSNQLHFDPLHSPDLLATVLCRSCNKSAYWVFYWHIEQMGILGLFAQSHMEIIRERIHMKKSVLSDFLNKKYA